MKNGDFGLEDRIILVTGSTDGIGRQTALELAAMGASVIVHGRSMERLRSAVSGIKMTTANERVGLAAADLSSLDQVRRLSGYLHKKYGRLDVLINNAGVYEKACRTSGDGYEMTFAVNYLAPFLLSLLLLDLLAASGRGRIVNVASRAHSSSLDFGNLQGEKDYDPYRAYAYSKTCGIMFTLELADRLKGSCITANCLHPGVINTKLLRAAFGGGDPVTEGSKTPVYLAASPDLEGVTGRFVVGRREERPAAVAYDAKARKRLWDLSEKLAGMRWEDASRALHV